MSAPACPGPPDSLLTFNSSFLIFLFFIVVVVSFFSSLFSSSSRNRETPPILIRPTYPPTFVKFGAFESFVIFPANN